MRAALLPALAAAAVGQQHPQHVIAMQRVQQQQAVDYAMQQQAFVQQQQMQQPNFQQPGVVQPGVAPPVAQQGKPGQHDGHELPGGTQETEEGQRVQPQNNAGQRLPQTRSQQCPKALNVTTWNERVKAEPVVEWDRNVDAETAEWAMHRHGVLQGQDEAGKWFDIVVRGRNPDGTYSGVVFDRNGKGDQGPPSLERRTKHEEGTGEPWPKMYISFMRVRKITNPTTPFMTVKRNACAQFPTACLMSLAPTEVTRITQSCAAALPQAFWGALTRPQIRSLPPRIAEKAWGLSTEACKQFSAEAAGRLQCQDMMSDDCAAGLPLHALRALPPGCVAKISTDAFSTMAGDRAGAILAGAGKSGLRPEQIRALPRSACKGVTEDWAHYAKLGTKGDQLCAAIPHPCWGTGLDGHGHSPDPGSVPVGCLRQLHPQSIRDLTIVRPGKQGSDGTKMCKQGEETLTLGLGPDQRAALAPAMCDACLTQWGGRDLFPQCAGAPLRGINAAKTGSTHAARQPWVSSQQMFLAAAAITAFVVGVVIARRRAA